MDGEGEVGYQLASSDEEEDGYDTIRRYVSPQSHQQVGLSKGMDGYILT